MVDKFQLALTCIDQDGIDLRAEPGQIIPPLIRLRNHLMHNKPKTNYTDRRHTLEAEVETPHRNQSVN